MYYVVFIPLYLLSLLPLPVLYLLSDVISAFNWYVIGYRKKVVLDNLRIAFPEKTEAERKTIAKKFYRNFVDNFIETIKLITASRAFITRHFQLDANPLNELHRSGRKCQLHLGHNFNWEVANVAMPYYTDYTFIVVYMPIKNKAMDRLFMYLRTRTGSKMLPATNMRNAIVPYRSTQYLLALVADQAPGDVSKAYWLNFFGQPTPFVRGPESGARVGEIPVIFSEIYKVKRGYYRARLEVGAENPRELPEGELTRRYIAFLERSISDHPDMWLWSHRRWKHPWKPEYKKLWIGQEQAPL
ncbi:lysophospholipid acyltransferase family protein [Paraflavitalea sp. CAU 1676]|uniref:lysophospholipid acyltransferase family protein n=1 Tax=Paraflavitalea sp. CAU 1676 TaxID=3032598 RepID=UPI0023DB6B98|nr:lysophospholipid acyltransferase family protein [Paraflavitalea sp. CAU 1676]MDF2186995.1 lysophospholipid acyltransferase family protein [Paraflavitalea sp. CAU 1676]